MLFRSLVFAIGMWAQDPIAFRPYYWNGFENATENANWTMVSDNSNPLNKWVVGSAMSSISTNSTKLLYVSYDNGTSAGFNGNGLLLPHVQAPGLADRAHQEASGIHHPGALPERGAGLSGRAA